MLLYVEFPERRRETGLSSQPCASPTAPMRCRQHTSATSPGTYFRPPIRAWLETALRHGQIIQCVPNEKKHIAFGSHTLGSQWQNRRAVWTKIEMIARRRRFRLMKFPVYASRVNEQIKLFP